MEKDQQTCPTCGKDRIPGHKFCTGCGMNLHAADQQAAATPAPEVPAETAATPKPASVRVVAPTKVVPSARAGGYARDILGGLLLLAALVMPWQVRYDPQGFMAKVQAAYPSNFFSTSGSLSSYVEDLLEYPALVEMTRSFHTADATGALLTFAHRGLDTSIGLASWAFALLTLLALAGGVVGALARTGRINLAGSAVPGIGNEALVRLVAIAPLSLYILGSWVYTFFTVTWAKLTDPVALFTGITVLHGAAGPLALAGALLIALSAGRAPALARSVPALAYGLVGIRVFLLVQALYLYLGSGMIDEGKSALEGSYGWAVAGIAVLWLLPGLLDAALLFFIVRFGLKDQAVVRAFAPLAAVAAVLLFLTSSAAERTTFGTALDANSVPGFSFTLWPAVAAVLLAAPHAVHPGRERRTQRAALWLGVGLGVGTMVTGALSLGTRIVFTRLLEQWKFDFVGLVEQGVKLKKSITGETFQGAKAVGLIDELVGNLTTISLASAVATIILGALIAGLCWVSIQPIGAGRMNRTVQLAVAGALFVLAGILVVVVQGSYHTGLLPLVLLLGLPLALIAPLFAGSGLSTLKVGAGANLGGLAQRAKARAGQVAHTPVSGPPAPPAPPVPPGPPAPPSDPLDDVPEADVTAAKDPATPAAELQRLAAEHRALWDLVHQHPNAYEGLKDWIDSQR